MDMVPLRPLSPVVDSKATSQRARRILGIRRWHYVLHGWPTSCLHPKPAGHDDEIIVEAQNLDGGPSNRRPAHDVRPIWRPSKVLCPALCARVEERDPLPCNIDWGVTTVPLEIVATRTGQLEILPHSRATQSFWYKMLHIQPLRPSLCRRRSIAVSIVPFFWARLAASRVRATGKSG